jgi:hypothetical protein
VRVDGEGGRDRKKAEVSQSERQSIGQKWKWRGLEWPLVKMDTRVFLVMQINRTNKLSIKLGGPGILPFLCFTTNGLILTFSVTNKNTNLMLNDCFSINKVDHF